MSNSALTPEILNDHLSHIVTGLSMREIARRAGVPASTVTRRLNKVEELRSHPDWDGVITALEGHYQRAPVTNPGRDFIAAALNTSVARVSADFSQIVPLAMARAAVFMIGEFENAALTKPNRPPLPFSRNSALAGLAFGWLEASGTTNGPVRTFKHTPTIVECTNPPEHTKQVTPKHRPGRYSENEPPVEALFRRRDQTLITADHVRLSQDFHEVYVMRESLGAPVYDRVSSGLPPRMLNLLNEICGKRIGFEATEKSMNLPARSAKALISFALDCFALARVQ
ncbi:winged helix-turn-helix domain-containing protein [Roseobacter litoralis]|uniref:winged helix-turn-helix domain-containing protein n=1 Tax=Roseobacter litoralis TaxID=42443 RepID=UPI002493D777|nr:winged helix-turn-helix domain-containing protein [Roseobacter litoralis]